MNNNDPTYEELIDELTRKLEKFYEWAKKTNQRIAELEKAHTGLDERSTTPRSNLVNAHLWSETEEEYLVAQLRNVSPIRPRLLELEKDWQNRFGVPRSYDALRKKYNRLKT